MLEFLFSQYKNYSTLDISLELIAIAFGLLSVLFAKKNNVWVFPTGIVNTALYVYLLYKWNLLGDMMINFYYVVMSIYGWYQWKNSKNHVALPITTMNTREKKLAFVVFLLTVAFVVAVYLYFDKFTSNIAYLDIVATGVFFVGMWLMAKRKLENWLFWIVGDLISVPMYFIKGYTFTSIQYLIFTLIAVFGYLEWKKTLQKTI